MSIANMCEECQLSNFAKDQTDMEILLSNVSTAFMELVNDSFVHSTFTRRILNTKWHQEANSITFRQETTMLTEFDCEQILVKKFAENYGVKESSLNKI